jgi:hypothetical protein
MTSPKQADELLPCPFCGAQAEITHRLNFNWARCSYSDCFINNHEVSPERWNRRSHLQPPGEWQVPDDPSRAIAKLLAKLDDEDKNTFNWLMEARRVVLAAAPSSGDAKPIPMLLYCPDCGLQHVDAPQPGENWTNPPHRSHECQHCGTVWRPADVATTGVEKIATAGKNDTSPVDRGFAAPVAEPPAAQGEAVEEAFEKTIVAPLRGRYDEKQRVADFAMFSLGYNARHPGAETLSEHDFHLLSRIENIIRQSHPDEASDIYALWKRLRSPVAQGEAEHLVKALNAIAQRANESGIGEIAERETIYAMHRIAIEAVARHPSHPTGSEPHALASAETDTKMLAAWTAERYPGDYAPYFNLTMVRHQGDLVLTVRLPTVYGAPPGAVSRVRFNREMWKEFMKIVDPADRVFKACDELDASAL